VHGAKSTGAFIQIKNPHVPVRLRIALHNAARLSFNVIRNDHNRPEKSITIVASPTQVLQSLAIARAVDPRRRIDVDVTVSHVAIYDGDAIFP